MMLILANVSSTLSAKLKLAMKIDMVKPIPARRPSPMRSEIETFSGSLPQPSFTFSQGELSKIS